MTSTEAGLTDVARAVADALDLPAAARAACLAARLPHAAQRAAADQWLRACELAAANPVLDMPAAQFAAPIVAESWGRERAVPEALRAALDGRYAVERELARGGQATVYLARDERHSRLVALK